MEVSAFLHCHPCNTRPPLEFMAVEFDTEKMLKFMAEEMKKVDISDIDKI
jgi:hypothetical protein